MGFYSLPGKCLLKGMLPTEKLMTEPSGALHLSDETGSLSEPGVHQFG